MNQNCKCGSGLPNYPLYDARRIYVARVCNSCVATVKSKYRTDIWDDPNYETEETIDGDQ